MGESAVELRGVSKRYFLGDHLGSGRNLRDVVTSYLAHRGRPPVQELWSLRDVSLDVSAGEALGMVGRNGAGKSTLLKVVARICEPTSGMSRTRGRVGSLLEVGTGFHPDLTGRENVFLNGAVLGMSRREVGRKFDDIIDFAGVSRFVDTPVKRFSSGMYMRLAFAVAAYLDAEIMVVDEVLAVGDAEFQQRCLGKMSEIERSGRTILFVSHNMDAVRRLCTRSVWLDQGEIRSVGSTGAVLDAYLESGADRSGRHSYPERPGAVVLSEAAVLDARGEPAKALARDEPFVLEIVYEVREPVAGLDLSAVVADLRGHKILDEALSDTRAPTVTRPGTYTARLSVPPVLNVGEYTVSIWLGTSYEELVWEENALRFRLDGQSNNRPDRLLHLGLRWDTDPLTGRSPEWSGEPVGNEGAATTST